MVHRLCMPKKAIKHPDLIIVKYLKESKTGKRIF